jgi:hypothetical protein
MIFRILFYDNIESTPQLYSIEKNGTVIANELHETKILEAQQGVLHSDI